LEGFKPIGEFLPNLVDPGGLEEGLGNSSTIRIGFKFPKRD